MLCSLAGLVSDSLKLPSATISPSLFCILPVHYFTLLWVISLNLGLHYLQLLKFWGYVLKCKSFQCCVRWGAHGATIGRMFLIGRFLWLSHYFVVSARTNQHRCISYSPHYANQRLTNEPMTSVLLPFFLFKHYHPL